MPELLVENSGACRVLFLEGEELEREAEPRPEHVAPGPGQGADQGARQLRRAGSVAVHQQALRLGQDPLTAPHALRLEVVGDPFLADASHRSDQSAVWQEVQKTHAMFDVASPTSAPSDTYANLADQMTDYRAKLTYPEGAVGVAIAVGTRVVCVDLFDKPATCEKAWDRLLSGSIVDALAGSTGEAQADAGAVEKVLAEANATTWTEAPAVGDGQEFRAEFKGSIGSALMLDGAVVHMNVLTAPA